jgi:predicted metal-binding membrane protein
MDAMPMAGGAAMSTMWMRMAGQSWTGAMASFVATWTVMMVAMMLPSLVPMLSRYRQAIGMNGAGRLDVLTLVVAIGYFAAWSALGVMDLRVMAVVTAAITAERLAPAGARVARAIGVVGIVAGTLLIARAVGAG